MAFCSKCGTAVPAESRFCPQCGQTVNSSAPGATPATPAPDSSQAGIPQNVAGLLCYVFGLVTGILFLVLEPYSRDPFVRFHAFQSIFYNVAAIVVSIAAGLIPFLGWFLSPLVGLAFVVGWVLLMVQAYQGRKWKLPVVGDLAEKQA